jgi:hypothetical protein
VEVPLLCIVYCIVYCIMLCIVYCVLRILYGVRFVANGIRNDSKFEMIGNWTCTVYCCDCVVFFGLVWFGLVPFCYVDVVPVSVSVPVPVPVSISIL